MTAFSQDLDTASGQAACQFLQAAGGYLVGAGIWKLSSGVGLAPGLATMGLGGAALLAKNLACDQPWDPNTPGSLAPTPGTLFMQPGSCLETEGCDLLPRDNQGRSFGPGRCRKMFNFRITPPAPNGTPLFGYSYINCDGEQIEVVNAEQSRLPLYTEVEEGGRCKGDPAPPAPPPTFDFSTTTQVNDCTYNLELQGLVEQGGGIAGPVWKISPGEDVRRNSGGIIGGCNFEPVIHYSPMPPDGPGGPQGPNGPWYGPWDDDREPGPDGTPPWLDLLNDILGGVVSNVVSDAITEALERPYPGALYRIQSVCERNSQGEPVTEEVEYEIPELKGLGAALSRLDAIAQLLQPLKDFRQPICYVKPAEGDARTISFVSKDKSPNGNDYLRKRFCYRSKSGKDLGAVVDHWKNFEFDAGPFIVRHVGSSLGTLKVWAASPAEGQRVIFHAFAEAGVDPYQDGEWSIGSSNSSRLGMPGRMKIQTKGGYYWITARKGGDMRPLVAYT